MPATARRSAAATSTSTSDPTDGRRRRRRRLEHEEAISHLWALVYALRAELLTVERLKRFPPEEAPDELLQVARERRDRLVATMGRSIEEYVERSGERIAHGGAHFDARRLMRLAGWHEPKQDKA